LQGTQGCAQLGCKISPDWLGKIMGAFNLDLSSWNTPTTWLTFAAWFVVTYCYLAVGITGGYHRLLTHKSYKVPSWLRYFIVSGGYLALMGAPVSWVAVHRLHHQKSDLPGDPHSPRDGFEHALYKWMFDMEERQPIEEIKKQVPDLLEDKWLCMLGVDHSAKQAQLCLWVNIAVRVLILIAFGPVAFTANLIASILVFWSPQFVNTFCHLENWGYRTYEVRDGSRNVPWVGIMALGEGWHNNHHAFPKSARHGIKWYEIDGTWMMISFLEKIGLATEVVRPTVVSPEVIAKAKEVQAAMVAANAVVQTTSDSAKLVSTVPLVETPELELVKS